MSSRAVELAKKGVTNPGRVLPYLHHTYSMAKLDVKYTLYQRWHDIQHQKENIGDLLGEDEFVLIILDACRYDAFRDEYDAYFDGSLERCWSGANQTSSWFPTTWDGSYDLTYYSSSPYTFDYAHEDLPHAYEPSTSFARVVDLLEAAWDPIRSTTPPRAVTDIVLADLSKATEKRAVVHYMQPHQPYIGETQVLQWDIDDEELAALDQTAGTETDAAPRSPGGQVSVEDLATQDITYHEERHLERENYKDIDEQVKHGDVSEERFRAAYRDNLRLVLSEVKRLVSYLDCPVVISADHGEHLGDHFDELDNYAHPDQTHPVLREVPWFVVDDDSKGTKSLSDVDLDVPYDTGDDPALTDADVDERLRSLGYK